MRSDRKTKLEGKKASRAESFKFMALIIATFFTALEKKAPSFRAY